MAIRTEKEIIMRYKGMKFLEESTGFFSDYDDNERIALAYYQIANSNYYPKGAEIDNCVAKYDCLMFEVSTEFFSDDDGVLYVAGFCYDDGKYFAIVYDDSDKPYIDMWEV